MRQADMFFSKEGDFIDQAGRVTCLRTHRELVVCTDWNGGSWPLGSTSSTLREGERESGGTGRKMSRSSWQTVSPCALSEPKSLGPFFFSVKLWPSLLINQRKNASKGYMLLRRDCLLGRSRRGGGCVCACVCLRARIFYQVTQQGNLKQDFNLTLLTWGWAIESGLGSSFSNFISFEKYFNKIQAFDFPD